MPWLPDHIWEKQKQQKQQGKGGSGWLPDHIWEAQKRLKQQGKGGSGNHWKPTWKPTWKPQWKSNWNNRGQGGGWGKGLNASPSRKVWIGNLPENLDWKQLQEHMDQAGKTKWIEVFSGNGKGTGAAVYSSDADASNAIMSLNGTELAGAAIVCDAWEKKPKEDLAP